MTSPSDMAGADRHFALGQRAIVVQIDHAVAQTAAAAALLSD